MARPHPAIWHHLELRVQWLSPNGGAAPLLVALPSHIVAIAFNAVPGIFLPEMTVSQEQQPIRWP